jgi:hypothetical protein
MGTGEPWTWDSQAGTGVSPIKCYFLQPKLLYKHMDADFISSMLKEEESTVRKNIGAWPGMQNPSTGD